MHKIVSIILIMSGTLLMLPSCTGTEEKELTARDSLMLRIDSLERKVLSGKGGTMVDRSLAAELVKAYDSFSRKFPKDSLTPEIMFKAADINTSALQEHTQALYFYDRIIAEHPTYKRYPDALFLAGFTCQEKLQNGVKAKEYYDRLLKEFPSHELADDAQQMMLFFGKTDEQIIEELEKKNQEKMKQ